MRRIVLVLVLVVVLAIAGYMLLRPKRTSARAKSKTALTDSTGAAGSSAKAVRPAGRRTGRAAGKLKIEIGSRRAVNDA